MPQAIDLAAALDAEATPTVRQLTLGELVRAYFARNPTADGAYRLRKWVAALGDLDAWSVPADTLERLAEHMLAAGYKPGSVNGDLNRLGSVYRWAKRERICPRGFASPTLAVRRYAEGIRRIHISAEELTRLRAGSLTAPSPGFAAFIHALIDSGARKSEVLERRWRDFDADAGTLTAEKTKTERPRVLFLQAHTVHLFLRLGGPSPDPARLIFRGRYPDQARDYRRPWANLTGAIGRPELHLHELRHAAAADLLPAGVTAAVAAQVLGHSPEMLSRRYGHLETEALRAAMERRWRAAA